MLQYDSKCRLSAEELLKQPFLTKNGIDFTYMTSGKSRKDNENHLNKIKGGKGGVDEPILENEFHEKNHPEKQIN